MSKSDERRVTIVTRIMGIFSTAVFAAGAVCLITGQFARFM